MGRSGELATEPKGGEGGGVGQAGTSKGCFAFCFILFYFKLNRAIRLLGSNFDCFFQVCGSFVICCLETQRMYDFTL